MGSRNSLKVGVGREADRTILATCLQLSLVHRLVRDPQGQFVPF